MLVRVLRRIVRYPLIVVALILPCASAFAADIEAQELTLNERVYMASRVYAALDYFAHMQGVPDIDLDATYRAYLDKAIASKDRKTFTLASMEFLAALHNGHTAFLDRPTEFQGGGLPFIAQTIHGQWIVTESSIPALRRGDVIEKIDDRTFEQFYHDNRRYISASTEANARRQLFAREPAAYSNPAFAFYAHLFPTKFVLTLSGGRKVAIDRSAMPSLWLSETEGRWLEPGKVAIIRIPSFYAPEYEKRAIELIKDFQQASVLIIDVRGNDGGNTPRGLIAALMNRPYRFWTESVPLSIPFFRLQAQNDWHYLAFKQPMLSWQSPVQQPEKAAFTGKVAVLTDAGCFSACEDFVQLFKDNHRAVIAGQTTGGSTGQPYFTELGKGFTLMIGAQREYFTDGTPFEGIGIKPDVEASPTPEDLAHGRDSALEAALQAAR